MGAIVGVQQSCTWGSLELVAILTAKKIQDITNAIGHQSATNMIIICTL